MYNPSAHTLETLASPLALRQISTNLSNTIPPFGPQINGTIVFVFYEYRPNEIAAYAFFALFALVTVIHSGYLLAIKPRGWYFVPLILGGIAETFGYYGRVMSHKSPSDVGPWIMQNLLILTAAPCVAATIYMAFARIVGALGASKLAIMSPRWTTGLYVLLDIVCIMTQLAGTIMPASGDAHLIALSRQIILAGLIVQLGALSFFLINCWQVHKRLRQGNGGRQMQGTTLNWQTYFGAVEIATLLLMIRSTMRIVEYAQGSTGYVAAHEPYIYAFDAVPMFLIMACFAIHYPQWLVRESRQRKDGSWEPNRHARLIEM